MRAVVVMGVAGSGKTTVGRALAERLGWTFLDADDFHAPENIAKMMQGTPLTDEDREPWLRSLREAIGTRLERGEGVVLACSALRQRYRERLAQGHEARVLWVYLQGDFDTIWQRLKSRVGHYMKAEMLASQFEALEPPQEALVVSIQQPVQDIVDLVADALEAPADVKRKDTEHA